MVYGSSHRARSNRLRKRTIVIRKDRLRIFQMVPSGTVISMARPMKTSIKHNDVSQLGADMLQFVSSIDECATPDEVLNGLHKVVLPHTQINVLGAALFPLQWGDWGSVEKGKTVFLHKSTPAGWWDEHIELSHAHPAHGLLFAQLSLAPFT